LNASVSVARSKLHKIIVIKAYVKLYVYKLKDLMQEYLDNEVTINRQIMFIYKGSILYKNVYHNQQIIIKQINIYLTIILCDYYIKFRKFCWYRSYFIKCIHVKNIKTDISNLYV
jgi:hypothetical protein